MATRARNSVTERGVAGIAGGRVALTSAQLEALDSRIGGRLICAGDEGWEEAVLVWNAMAARRPALVVQPVSAADVAATVAFARDHGLLLGVKGGGHNIAGTAIADGGLNLDMSPMRGVSVDADGRLAHVGPGCLLQDVDRATQEHGLATVLGFVSETGVAGLTLGGGLGYLARRFGWTVDNLDEVEVVTADADVRIANRDEHADLFWALRGGGGNFGVVTRFRFRLHEVGPIVYGGLIAWPAARADDILAGYRAITADAPRELSTFLLALHAPPVPFVPERWHGQKVYAMAVCYSGDLRRADDALAPIRELSNPIVDLLAERPYTQMQSLFDETEPPGLHYYWKTGLASELSDDLLATTRDLFAECPVPGAELGYLQIGGALNERAWDDGAVGNRDARFAIGGTAMWEPDEPNGDTYRRWIRDAWEHMRPFSTGRTYVNFLDHDDEEERTGSSYGPNLDRLVAVKRRWDPNNLFRVNRNIRPSG
jgi:FAD/FMN-containing dehydrogenase